MTTEEKLIEIVKASSAVWKQAFNDGDYKKAAGQYESEALMVAKPFGTYRGTQAIEEFWKKMVEDGFAEVDYVEPVTFKVDGEDSVELAANWTMNKAKGVITKELWVVQEDGTAKLREDHFEALP